MSVVRVPELVDPNVSDESRQRVAKMVSEYLDARCPVAYVWNYETSRQDLRALYEKAKGEQWDGRTYLPWDIEVDPTAENMPDAQIPIYGTEHWAKLADKDIQELRRHFQSWTLSQFMHGEQGALLATAQIVTTVPWVDAKFYASTQVIDEARHVEVLSKFLQRKMGTIYPIGPTLKVLLDELLQVEGMQKKTLGMQTLFEGTAVGIMDLMRSESRNPFFTEMIRRVEQDESRHAAFGVLTMRRVVKEASENERGAMEDWAFSILEALNANQQLDMLRDLGPKYGIDGENLVRLMAGLPNYAELNSIAFMHTVVPNLQRLGLITERTEPGWRKAAMMVDQRGSEAGGQLPLVS
jgi:hypothetical protein